MDNRLSTASSVRRACTLALLAAFVGGCVAMPTGNRLQPGDYVMNLAQVTDTRVAEADRPPS